MKALRIHRPGGAEGLVYEDAPDPEPVTGDVLVEVRGAGFTPDELAWSATWIDRAGRDRTPSIPAHEVSGVVVAVGFGTSGFEVGDEVYGLTDSYRDGAAAGLVSVDARNLALKPTSIDHLQAASLPQTALTAWQALFRHGSLEPGQTVMVHGAAGAVGSIAAQLAHEAGTRVVGTGFARARDVALAHGVDTFVDLEAGPLEDAVEPVDLVFDTIGGEVLARSSAIVKPTGTVVSIVVPPPERPDGGPAVFFVVEPDRAQLREIAGQVDAGLLRPHVGATYPVSDGRAAFEAKRRGIPGKVVLQP
jgi:NADPH:quinone reductase-like Zn-dependent oxidoreductase